ncbi:hypothetical protein B0H16DRAFT_1699218 [Mycena metata]|uniref:Novel STAND NTPase 1 domain-containing protein n=1 Tax=Mycena metata TaxID=1033252 RepID=A0AAD7HKY6_9AGAR|nr:hypothetical protein B0H16DRAFT_1699218 [Mycena metata]
MPRPDPTTQARIHQLTTSLAPAVTLLEELNDAFGPPCVQPIIETVQALIAGVQVQTGFTMLNNVMQGQHEAEIMHKGLLEIIETLSDGTTSDRSSSHKSVLQEGQWFSTQLQLVLFITSKPKIFHGRDSELKHIMEVLSHDAPRIAILGGGGMGKTSLARAALHHTDVCAKFEHRFFVSAEAATTAVELAALIGLHLGLEPSKDLTKPVVRYFARQTGPCLLILDKLETPWEPIQSRGGVETFLSLLADVEHLALMTTDHYEGLRVTRPDEASEQIFEAITDDSHVSKERTQLLTFTENMPLAVDLMAHLVDHEGIDNVLTRWKAEKTAALSTGHHRTSNLDASIALSYSSPRITPGARELLRLLSILLDGLSDAELTQSKLPIGNIQPCKSTLIATSLAYKDIKSRLQSLVPIREHIQQSSPPSEALVQVIRKFFHHLLTRYERHNGTHLGVILSQITANLANLEEVLQRGLHSESSDLPETIQCVLSLNSFFRVTRDCQTALLGKIPISLFYAVAGTTVFGSNPNLEFLARGLKLSKSIGDSVGQCDCLIAMAELKWLAGNYRAALNISRNAQQLGYQTAALYLVSRAMNLIALSLTSLGDYVGGLTQLMKAREFLGMCGITRGQLHHNILNSQAEIHLQKSEYAEARSIHVMSLQSDLLDPGSSFYGSALLNLSLISVLIGATTDTVHHTLDQAHEIFTGVKHQFGPMCCTMILADLNLTEGNKALAKTQFKNCLKSAWATSAEVVSYCLERLADISRWPIELRQATWPVLYLCHAHMSKEKLAFYKALLFIGDLFIDVDEVTAESLFLVALEGFTFMDVHRSRAQGMLNLGDLAQKRGEITKAANLWTSAQPLFERSLQAKDVTAIDMRLVALEQGHKRSLARLAVLHAPSTTVNDKETFSSEVVSSKADEIVTSME